MIEVRTSGINKGTAGLRFVSQRSYDFIFSIGDDWTDEDLFAVLPPSAYTIKVGIADMHARYNLRDVREVIGLLSIFANVVARNRYSRCRARCYSISSPMTHILIVDDHGMVPPEMDEPMWSLDNLVVRFSSIDSALDHASSHTVDVVFVDGKLLRDHLAGVDAYKQERVHL